MQIFEEALRLPEFNRSRIYINFLAFLGTALAFLLLLGNDKSNKKKLVLMFK